MKLLERNYFSHPLPSTLRRTSYLDADLPPVGDGESVGCWEVTIHSAYGNACEVRSYQSNMAESLDAPERGSKKVRVCFLNALCAQCPFFAHVKVKYADKFLFIYLYIFIYIYIYIQTSIWVSIGTLRLITGQPALPAFRELQARFYSFFSGTIKLGFNWHS